MADYQKHGLYLHNWYRKRHGSPKMVLSDRLNQAADAYAYKLACRRQLVHTSGLDYNENLYMSTDTSLTNKKHVYKACELWYNEKEYYNFNRGGFSMQTGHFTAMVWKDSTQLGIGCGSANGCVVVVACYKPFANMQGQFSSNVLPWREVEDSEDEEEKKKKADEEEKKKKADEEEKKKKADEEEKKKKADKAEKKRQKETQKKEAEENEKNFSVENLPAPVQEAFASKADADSTIGWSELANILNDHMKIDFKFDGFDKTISLLLISMMTFRSGEKSRVGLDVLEDIWQCVETFIKGYTKYDKDRSGTLDPFELKAALEESGFKISYKTFKTLQKQFGAEEGNMDFRQFVLCFILLAKLQAVQELKSDTGMFEDFSLKDWLQEQLDAVSS